MYCKKLFFCRSVYFFLTAAKNPDGAYSMDAKSIEDFFGGNVAKAESLLTPPKKKQDTSLITQGRYKCADGEFTIRKKKGGANAWVLSFPAVYRKENPKGKRYYETVTEDFDCFQNGNRLISPGEEGFKEWWPDSKGCMIVTQIDANTVEIDPDRFPSFYSAGTQGGPSFPQGRCVKQ